MAKSNKKYKKLNSHSVEKMSKLAKKKDQASTTNGHETKEIKVKNKKRISRIRSRLVGRPNNTG